MNKNGEKKVGRPRGSVDLANFIRASARRAMEESEAKDGKSLADLLKVELQSRPLDFLKAISAYTPKEIDIVDDRDVKELSATELDERIARLAGRVEELVGRVSGGERAARNADSREKQSPRVH